MALSSRILCCLLSSWYRFLCTIPNKYCLYYNCYHFIMIQSHTQPPSRPPPPQYSAPRGPVKSGQHHRLGTPHHGPPPPAGASNKADNKLQIPDPFTRRVSRLPKKHLTQSSSRFQPRKLPPDYKPLPLLKGRHHNEKVMIIRDNKQVFLRKILSIDDVYIISWPSK